VTAAAPKETTAPLPPVTVPPLAEPPATTPAEPVAPSGTTAVPTTLQQTPVELPLVLAAVAGLCIMRRSR
jgi:hypothetical protein